MSYKKLFPWTKLPANGATIEDSFTNEKRQTILLSRSGVPAGLAKGKATSLDYGKIKLKKRMSRKFDCALPMPML